MARNGSGVHTKAVSSFSPGGTITAADHNSLQDDISSELTNSVAADGQTTITGALKGASGTVSLPGYAFSSDLDCGMYRIGANNIGLAVNGAKVLDIATTGLSVTGTFTPSDVIVGAAGTVSAPGYTFTGDLNTGIYAVGADNIGIAVGGTKIVDVATTGISVTGSATITSATGLFVGANGATNPAFWVDASATSVATGLKITGQAAAGSVYITTVSTGTNESLIIEAKGSGQISLNSTATGSVDVGHDLRVFGALTANATAGVTAKNTLKAIGVATYSGGTPTLVSAQSFNMGSITDTAQGRIRFTFTTAMADANYCVVATAEAATGATRTTMVSEKATTYFIVDIINENGALGDPVSVSAMVTSLT